MRKILVETLAVLARRDPRIVLLTADLGYGVLEPFSESFPARFINVGVDEQNMVGLATGLAESGFIPFVYSIATFMSMRPYEVIRNGPILHQFPVRIIGVGGGMEYGHNGISHYALEDIGIMRTQPDIVVVSPADSLQARTALLKTWDLPGPIYYRLGKDEATIVPGLNGAFELGRAQLIEEGSDLAFIAMGSITREVLFATQLLRQRGIHASLINVASLNPGPVDDLVAHLASVRHAVTVETHFVNGALGSFVAEVIAERGLSCRLRRCGVMGMPRGISGSRHFMEHHLGLSREALAEAAISLLN